MFWRKHRKTDDKKHHTHLSPEEYEQLGHWLQDIVESGHVNTRRMARAGFIKGLVSGAGGIIGATVTIFILLWALSLFHNVPLVGRFADKFRSSINTSQHIR